MPNDNDRTHLTHTLIDCSWGFELLKKSGIGSTALADRWQTTVTTVNRYHAATRAIPAWILLDLWDLVRAAVPQRYRLRFERTVTPVSRFNGSHGETPKKFVNRVQKARRKNGRNQKASTAPS